MAVNEANRSRWREVKSMIDLATVATNLLGPPQGRRGGLGGLWWKCPFHDDQNPSFHVNPVKNTWRCYGCSEHGDAAALVMKLNQCTFPEAVAFLAGKPVLSRKPGPECSAFPTFPTKHSPMTSGLPLADALVLVQDAAARLWTPEGVPELEYLQSRGLTDATIRQAGLGWTPGASIPIKDGARFWNVAGITIPWFDGDRLAMLKIRQPAGHQPKYVEVSRDRPRIFPSHGIIRPGKALIICEGELDALLLAQELVDLAVVVTLGSASARPDASTYLAMLPAPVWYVATDADAAGDRAANEWPAQARRVRPPAPCKDWTEAHQYPINLRRWWTERMVGNESPALSSWDELAARRWGPAIGDPTPGVIVDRIS